MLKCKLQLLVVQNASLQQRISDKLARFLIIKETLFFSFLWHMYTVKTLLKIVYNPVYYMNLSGIV